MTDGRLLLPKNDAIIFWFFANLTAACSIVCQGDHTTKMQLSGRNRSQSMNSLQSRTNDEDAVSSDDVAIFIGTRFALFRLAVD